MEHIASVFVQVIEKPERKAIIKRGRTAKEYWSYCQEVGCDVWDETNPRIQLEPRGERGYIELKAIQSK